MVVCVARRAAASGAASVVVATDDNRIAEAVAAAGFRFCMTRVDHQSGSDRIVEVADQLSWPDDAVVVNVQGDEPLIPPSVIDQVATALLENAKASDGVQVATLCEPIESSVQVFDPNCVKVVFDRNQRALYFSRAPIPFDRANFVAFAAAEGVASTAELGLNQWWRHIGIYGYRLGVLRSFVQQTPATIEQLESLEQLRFLQMGIPIHVYPACAPVPGGVDTTDDLAAVNQLLDNGGSN